MNGVSPFSFVSWSRAMSWIRCTSLSVCFSVLVISRMVASDFIVDSLGRFPARGLSALVIVEVYSAGLVFFVSCGVFSKDLPIEAFERLGRYFVGAGITLRAFDVYSFTCGFDGFRADVCS